MPSPSRWVLLAVLLALPARATVSPALRCQSTKLQAASTRTQGLLACRASATQAGTAVDPTCVARVAERFTAAFAAAEARGGCLTVGDGPSIASRVDAFADDALASAAPPGCAATMLAAAGRYAAARFAAYKGFKRSAGNAARLVNGQAHAASALTSYLNRQQCASPAADAIAAAAAALVQEIATPLLCGDGVRDPGEVCDAADDRACPGLCGADCRCVQPPAFSCLAGPGPTIALSGILAAPYETPLPAATRLDGRAATFVASPANLYPLNLRGGDGACLAGGRIAGQYDPTLTWQAMHDANNAGLRFENDAFTIDGLRIDDVGDGIRPVAQDFTVRAVWLSWVRDDCMENDHLHGGLIEDSLLDGCYVGISERPSPAILDSGFDGRRDALTIHGSLIRLQAMPGPDGGSPSGLGHGQFFKWHERATALALRDDVFLAEEVGQGGPDTMGVPQSLVDCAGNVMVWLGSGDYPAPLPPCFTVTHDRTVWDAKVADWHRRHPEVGGP